MQRYSNFRHFTQLVFFDKKVTVISLEKITQEIERISNTIDYFKKIRIIFGVFEEDGRQMETISVYNTDGTVTEEKMSLSDIMYLTEKGTIMIPPKPVLESVYGQINFYLPRMLDEIVHGIEYDNWDTIKIREKFNWFNTQINEIYIPNAITMVLSSDNFISGLLNEKEDQNYTFDLKKLKKYIKSKIFFIN